MKTKVNICDIVKKLYYSGFCLTDDKTFCEFYIHRFPKLNQEFKTFKFDKENLSFEIGNEVTPIENKKNVQFDDFFLDNINLYSYFTVKYKEIKFFWFNKWLGRKRSNLVSIVQNGKLIGLLKVKKGRLQNESEIQENRKSSRKKVILKRKIGGDEK